MTAVMGNYGRIDLAFDHGDGAWLVTADGERYLDCAAGIAVNTLGHGHPHLVSALKNQAEKLWHVSNLYRIPEQEQLAQTLTRLSGLNKAFFCNSGAEATEAAVKMARRAMHHRGEHGRHTILSSQGAFHGRTIAMLAATDRPVFREGFGPMPTGFDHFPFGNMNVLRDQLAQDAKDGDPGIAAVMVESVQGEGGAKPLPEHFMEELRAACDEFGCLLIADEVQIGVGRSGHIFSFEQSGIKPDIVAMAKGLAGGFPIGAVLATDEVAAGMTAGSHGSTFGGNPLAMASANAVLEVLESDGFMAGVRARSARLAAGLDEISTSPGGKFCRRGHGFLQGLVFHDDYPAMDVVKAYRDHHILTVPASENTVRLLPPLTLNDDEISRVLDVTATIMTDLEKAT
ncbi:MAG: acetylornithine transaminase [Alphaproteobacteria bacterium]|nr:acetylornithine transaminase [Alphaproteobacteria bacterium]